MSENPCTEMAVYSRFGPRRIVAVTDLELIYNYAAFILNNVKAEPLDEAAREILFIVDALLDVK